MIWRQDIIVIQEFVIYPTGTVFFDQMLTFKNEKLANAYLQEYWYDRYGEENIKKHSSNDEGIVHETYYYVEVAELGLRDGSDISKRCFSATWCPTIKTLSDLDL